MHMVFCSLVAALAIAILPSLVVAQTSSNDEQQETLRSLQGALDPAQIDALGYALATQDLDPEALAGQMARDFAYQPYSGVLRGADGMVASQAGNAWDGALLLSEILQGRGFDVRFARTDLDDDTAALLLTEIGSARLKPPFSSVAEATEILEAVAADNGFAMPRDIGEALTVPATTGEFPPEIADVAGNVLSTLGTAMPDGSALAARTQQDARDYVWVQYRQGPDPWKDLHIFLPAQTPLTPRETFESVDQSAIHEVAVSLQLETMTNRQRETEVIVPRTPVYGGDKGQLAVVLTVVPDFHLRGREAPETDTDVYYVPIVAGHLINGTRAFSLEGETRDTRGLQNTGIASASASVVDGFGGLASALGGLNSTIGEASEPDRSAAESVVTALILQVSYRPAFAREEITFEARLLDLLPPDDGIFSVRGEPKRSKAPAGIWTVFVVSGGETGALILNDNLRSLRQLLNSEELSSEVFDTSLAFSSFFNMPWNNIAGITYRSEPLIAVQGVERAEDDSGLIWLDIMQSGLRSYDDDGTPAPELVLRTSMTETWLEGVWTSDFAARFSSHQTGSSAWSDLSDADALVAVESAEEARLAGASDFDARRLNHDLALDQIVLLSPGEDPAWWRIDPVTGAAIGTDRFGRGGSFEEKIITIAFYSLSVVDLFFTYVDLKQCTDAYHARPYDRFDFGQSDPRAAVLFHAFVLTPLMNWTTAKTFADGIAKLKSSGFGTFRFLTVSLAAFSILLQLGDSAPSDKVFAAIC